MAQLLDGHELAAAAKKPPSPVKTALYVFTLAVIAAVIGVLFNALFVDGAALSGSVLDKLMHTVLAIVLGMVLVLRLAYALHQFSVAKAALCSFYAAASTIAICGSHVSEALTISAGAEHEKKGIFHFRSELARLLGFGVRCMTTAIKGQPLLKDTHLMTVEDMLVINGAQHPTPTLFATKLVAKLVAQQREAGRLDSALCAEVNAQVGAMVGAYHTVMSVKKMRPPAAISEFATAWLFGFCFTVPIVISSFTYATPWVSPCASLFIAAFFFALNEIAVQLEDLSTIFAYDLCISESERQIMYDLQLFASESTVTAEGML
jgi:predicted membrane chloride channel (bestrophin family)